MKEDIVQYNRTGKTANEGCGAISLTVVETQGRYKIRYLRLPFRD